MLKNKDVEVDSYEDYEDYEELEAFDLGEVIYVEFCKPSLNKWR